MFSIAPAGFGASTLANLSGTGALAGGAGAGAGAGGLLASLGPWGAAAAGLNLGAQAIGGIMEQTAADKAINEANKNLSRNWGFQDYTRDRERGAQAAALREGYGFMQSPVFQSRSRQDFADAYSLAGKFNPYLTGLATRLR